MCIALEASAAKGLAFSGFMNRVCRHLLGLLALGVGNVASAVPKQNNRTSKNVAE